MKTTIEKTLEGVLVTFVDEGRKAAVLLTNAGAAELGVELTKVALMGAAPDPASLLPEPTASQWQVTYVCGCTVTGKTWDEFRELCEDHGAEPTAPPKLVAA